MSRNWKSRPQAVADSTARRGRVASPGRWRILAHADTDSLPDAWETEHFGSVPQGADDDFDGDSTNNRVEFLLGLDPADGSSAFRAMIVPAGGGFTLTWPTAAGLNFRVERSTTLDGIWTDLGTMQTGTYTDLKPPVCRAFYQVSCHRARCIPTDCGRG